MDDNKLQLVSTSYNELINDTETDVAKLIKIKRAINNLSSKNQIFFVQNNIDDDIKKDIARIKKENVELKEMLLNVVEIMRKAFK